MSYLIVHRIRGLDEEGPPHGYEVLSEVWMVHLPFCTVEQIDAFFSVRIAIVRREKKSSAMQK